MNQRQLHRWLLLIMVMVMGICMAGCAANESAAQRQCQVVLEESEAYTADRMAALTVAGREVRFCLTPAAGYTLTGTDYEGGVLTRTADGVELTLPDVQYTVTVSVTYEESNEFLYYHANCGERIDGGDAQEWVAVPSLATHLRRNTAIAGELFTREGYTLVSWNTAADGSGTRVGLGSRIEPESHLYAQWAQWNDASEFTWTQDTGGASITGWSGESEVVVIPETLGGVPVDNIASDAFAGADMSAVILPSSLVSISEDAFRDCKRLTTVTLYDSLHAVTDYAFSGCDALQTLYINAATAPVYSGRYHSTWADKYDRLRSLAGARKMVLFSGSSARFGYDSVALHEAFPAYEVANMGVFAYSNALPLLDLIEDVLTEGDVLLLSPEFDAAKRQFCTTNAFDDDYYTLMEADYDEVARLDLREYSAVFSSLGSYLGIRSGMTARSYDLSALDYDEDGEPVETPSYNAEGDYILYRENAADDTPIYGLGVEYTVAAFPERYLDAANAAWVPLTERGIHVYMTYSPRNSLAVSENTTAETIAELDAWLREGLEIPVISRLADSLMPGRYFYGTDNHLSTEGVTIRTTQVIEDLRAQMQKEGILE